MKIVAAIDVLDQIGPYDYRVTTRTAVFEDGSILRAVMDWARHYNPNIKPHDIRLSEAE